MRRDTDSDKLLKPISSIPAASTRENYGRIDAANLMRAKAFLKSGRAIGKIVLAGF
jgi:hypothetical protein